MRFCCMWKKCPERVRAVQREALLKAGFSWLITLAHNLKDSLSAYSSLSALNGVPRIESESELAAVLGLFIYFFIQIRCIPRLNPDSFLLIFFFKLVLILDLNGLFPSCLSKPRSSRLERSQQRPRSNPLLSFPSYRKYGGQPRIEKFSSKPLQGFLRLRHHVLIELQIHHLGEFRRFSMDTTRVMLNGTDTLRLKSRSR